MIKRYVIHILAITAIKEDTFDLPPENNAMIICTNRSNPYIRILSKENILVSDFPDVEDKRYPGAFNGAHARKIIRFVENLPKEVSDIYVCCSKGGSRSPAVAAALLRMSGRSDWPVWLNVYYVPNLLVYYRLCKEYKLLVSKIGVKARNYINNVAWRRAQRGKPNKHERWEILF